MNSGKEYSVEDACKMIDKQLENNTFKVNFTGGEPLVQHEAIKEMAKHIKLKNIPTYLESSCYDSEKFSHVLPLIDFVKIEFKTKESEFVDSSHYSNLLENAFECLKLAIKSQKTTFIKIVVSEKTTLDDFKELVSKIFKAISKNEISGFIIQPTTGIAEPSLEKLLQFYDVVFPLYNQVRVIPQLHKLIGAP